MSASSATNALPAGPHETARARARPDGTFAGQRDYPAGKDSTGVALGDLNADGRLDVVIANSGLGNRLPSVNVLLATKDGAFAASVNYPTSEWTEAVALGDLNGGFGRKAAYAKGASGWALVVGDVNHDGRPDLVLADRPNLVTVLLGGCE